MNALLEGGCLNPQNNGTTLKLPDAVHRLPTLANNCYLVGEAKRADIIWTEGDFLALCEHMLNDNPPEHFLSVWIDKESREPQFKKPSFRYRADKRARWAWATVTGKGHSPDCYRLLSLECR